MPAPNSFYRISPSENPPLRIGLLLDSKNELPAFCVRIVEDIQASNFAQIKLLVLRKSTVVPAPASQTTNSHRGPIRHILDPKLRRRLVYDLYLRLDSRKSLADNPIAKTACADLLDGIETLEVEPIGKKFVHRFPDDALAAIRSHNLDVLIRFGFNILHGDILRAARYGVWSYHHGDNEFYRGGPPHFWELVEDSLLTGVILQVLSEDLDDGLVLCKSQFATENTISVSRNRYGPYWGSAEMMIRKLNELHQFGWQSLLDKAIPSAPYKGKRAIYKSPTNGDLLPWLTPVLVKKAASYPFRRPTVQHWKIAYRADAKPLYDSDSPERLSDFRWLEAPREHFWADPFGVEHEGQNWVFFEDYSYAENRAGIVAAQLSEQGQLSVPVPCLEHPSQHFSYPHVFLAGSEIFMIPESYDANSVGLYRCQRFPGQWVREATLLEGRFVDTTVWKHEGFWWMLTTTAEPHPRAGSLLLFYANLLTGPWRFHPANPISTDIRRNRGGGRIIQTGDRLIRPSQCCAPTYGYSLGFNEVTELSPKGYAERPLATITPEHWKNFSGVHTYNRAGRIEWIDGCRTMPLKRVANPARP
jgi:hypothetical protein